MLFTHVLLHYYACFTPRFKQILNFDLLQPTPIFTEENSHYFPFKELTKSKVANSGKKCVDPLPALFVGLQDDKT